MKPNRSMVTPTLPGILLVLVAAATAIGAVKVQQPTSRPAWSAEDFAYQPPKPLQVSPSDERIHRRVSNSKQRVISFRNTQGELVPVLITVPTKAKQPCPVVLLLHGLASNKAQITEMAADNLVARGLACMALDFPRHGSRPGHPDKLFLATDPQATFANIQQAVIDIRQCIDLAATQEDLNVEAGVGLLGYSMGSWFGTLAAAADQRIKAVVLMVGGTGAVDFPERSGTDTAPAPDPSADSQPADAAQSDLGSASQPLDATTQPASATTTSPEPTTPPSALELYKSIRPKPAIAQIWPRPILMLNGRADRFVPKEQTEALFDAAGHPKQLRWYNAGHLLPTRAFDEAAQWLAGQWIGLATGRRQ